jgi:hypothetical protein
MLWNRRKYGSYGAVFAGVTQWQVSMLPRQDMKVAIRPCREKSDGLWFIAMR